MLKKLFGRSKKTSPGPDLVFGRYSDNNKPVAKITSWTTADRLFREKNYTGAMDSFFDYLKDDDEGNVKYERNGSSARFEIYQGSKIVKGKIDGDKVLAEVTLARMPQPNIPVMRRLLEMNFNLFYSRFALDGDRLCMRFDTEVHAANPSKLYFGLKELATKGDKQDDLLVLDFSTVRKADHDHVTELQGAEREIKFNYLRKWIQETIDMASSLDQVKFSGGISFLLLSMLFRIDYLVCPEGKLLRDLENTIGIYYKKDERHVSEKNRDMIEALRKILERSKDETFVDLVRSRYTFSMVTPQTYRAVIESINASNQNVPWYRENNYPHIANSVMEYGISFCQYTYSLPKLVTDLYHIFMMVNYSSYFSDLGYRDKLYDQQSNSFNSRMIAGRIKTVLEEWSEKYPRAQFRTEALRFDSLVDFNQSFTTELTALNLEG